VCDAWMQGERPCYIGNAKKDSLECHQKMHRSWSREDMDYKKSRGLQAKEHKV